jgi:hypothetical protein
VLRRNRRASESSSDELESLLEKSGRFWLCMLCSLERPT